MLGTITGRALPEGLPARLRDALGFALVDAVPIDPGVIHNNRLFRLRGEDGRDLVAKVYYRDGIGRLEREFGSFRFLRGRSTECVPRPYLTDEAEQYAVYSFEPGRTKTPAMLSVAELAAIGRLAAELHRFRRGEPGDHVPRAFAEDTLAGRIAYLRRRLAACLAAGAAPEAYPELRAVVAEVDVAGALERLIAAATAGVGGAQLAERVPEEHLRLNPGDFAPHNIIARPDGTLCAIDFEYAGWDDAAALPASFLTAEQSAGLTKEQRDAFLGSYRAACGVPDDALARFEPLLRLIEAGQILTSLSLMTPAHVARKRFAGHFDLAVHLTQRRRMIEEGVRRTFGERQSHPRCDAILDGEVKFP